MEMEMEKEKEKKRNRNQEGKGRGKGKREKKRRAITLPLSGTLPQLHPKPPTSLGQHLQGLLLGQRRLLLHGERRLLMAVVPCEDSSRAFLYDLLLHHLWGSVAHFGLDCRRLFCGWGGGGGGFGNTGELE